MFSPESWGANAVVLSYLFDAFAPGYGRFASDAAQIGQAT
jgi:hypothetical protein